jgi:hypothetical protein
VPGVAWLNPETRIQKNVAMSSKVPNLGDMLGRQLENLDEEMFINLFSRQLELLLNIKSVQSLKPKLDVQFLKQTVKLRDPVFDCEVFNVLFPLLPAPYVFTSIRAKSIEGSIASLISSTKPWLLTINELEITIADPDVAPQISLVPRYVVATPSRAKAIKLEWESIVGPPGTAQYTRYEPTDGVTVEIKELKVQTQTKLFPGGEATLHVPHVECFRFRPISLFHKATPTRVAVLAI